MVSQRPLVIACVLTGMMGLPYVNGADVPPPKPETPAKKVEIPYEQRPYRIKMFFSVDQASGVDAGVLEPLTDEWLRLVRRFVGAPWQVELSAGKQESIEAAEPATVGAEAFQRDWGDFDKVWVIRARGDGSSLAFEGREYDVETRRLGPYQRTTVPVLLDAARVFFRFTLDLFSPSATVGEHFGKTVALVVQGGALPASTEIGRVVSKGTVFLPLRIVQKKGGGDVVQEIALTYLQVESVSGSKANASLVSSFKDPFTKRVLQKNRLVAIGIKPGKSRTRLSFTTLPDKAPAAGYVLTAKRFPDGTVRDVGTTDRQGRITLEPGVTDGLTIFRLVAGNAEPMREFPLMPGENDQERAIPPFDPLHRTIAIETRLDSLRDTVIDMIAIRARLEAQIKGRCDSGDLEGAESSMKVFQGLSPKSTFADQLEEIRKGATVEQSKSKSPVLTKTVQSQFAEIEALIARYLDDEGFNGLAREIDSMKAGASPEAATDPKKSAAAALKKPAPPKPVAPSPAKPPQPKPEPPAGKPAAAASPKKPAVPF